MSIDQQFVEFIIKSLVSNPDAVQVERRIDEKGVLLELTVDPEDLGRVIGKRGATAQSVRTLLRALGTKNDARYNLKIVDNGEPSDRRGPSQHSDDNSQQSSDDHHHSDDHDDQQVEHKAEEPEVEAEESDAREDVRTEDSERTSNVVSKTRKELEEFDDLDV
jgi:predicted RNA-binding protein YlqC (UPF0109 family)